MQNHCNNDIKSISDFLCNEYYKKNLCVTTNCFVCSDADEKYISILQKKIFKNDNLKELICLKGQAKRLRYEELNARTLGLNQWIQFDENGESTPL